MQFRRLALDGVQDVQRMRGVHQTVSSAADSRNWSTRLPGDQGRGRSRWRTRPSRGVKLAAMAASRRLGRHIGWRAAFEDGFDLPHAPGRADRL